MNRAKYIDENLALNFSDGSEVGSFKTRKSHGLSSSQHSTWGYKCH